MTTHESPLFASHPSDDATAATVSAPVAPAAPLGLADDHLVAIAAAAERRIEAVQKIKRLVLKVTNAQDWTDQGGRPYLQVSGAEKVARLFGISWRLGEPTRIEHDDGHFSYVVKGAFSMGTAEIEVLGTRASRDPFFAQAKGREVPVSEIDRNDVLKAAVTNCLGNGITRLLGIRNLTWEDLEAAGIKRAEVGKVDYRTGSEDPLTAPTIPFGPHKGKPPTDPSVSVADLEYQLKAAEKALADPARAKWAKQNEALRDAIQAELARRQPASPAPVAEPGPPAAAPTPAPAAPSASAPVPDEQWADCLAYLEDDPERAAVMKEVVQRFKPYKRARDLAPDLRRPFLLTVADVLRQRGIAHEPFVS